MPVVLPNLDDVGAQGIEEVGKDVDLLGSHDLDKARPRAGPQHVAERCAVLGHDDIGVTECMHLLDKR